MNDADMEVRPAAAGVLSDDFLEQLQGGFWVFTNSALSFMEGPSLVPGLVGHVRNFSNWSIAQLEPYCHSRNGFAKALSVHLDRAAPIQDRSFIRFNLNFPKVDEAMLRPWTVLLGSPRGCRHATVEEDKD